VVWDEKGLCEDYIIDVLVSVGWKYSEPEDLPRESYEEPLLTEELRDAIRRVNRGVPLSERDVEGVITSLKSASSGPEGSKRVLSYIKDGISIKPEDMRTLYRVWLIDYDNLGNNKYTVSRQVVFQHGEMKKIRTDVVLFVNGIPLVVIECKDPTSPTTTWMNAYRQIKRYEREVPELFKYVQIGIASGDKTVYFPTVSWAGEVPVTHWRAEGIDDPLEAMGEMLKPDIFLDILKNYVFFREQGGQSIKVVPRYMQYRAATRIYERVLGTIKGVSDKKSGLIWHWQGSGKTLTMIFAAYKLFRDPVLQNPTVFFIVDRRELQEQISGELSYLGIPFKTIRNIEELKRVLSHDEGRGERGLFVMLIHKFQIERLRELKERLREGETIAKRQNVIAFLDEAHRTQYGLLASTMRSILREAFFFAFTGTPISKKERDTYRLFGYEDERYLDRYFILRSIEDGYTVPIYYQARLEKDVHLDKGTLKAFLDSEFEEIPEEIGEEVKERLNRKLNVVRVHLKNPERIEVVAKDVSKHFSENVDGKFKALVVAVDREACVLYKKELDHHLPAEYSEVVMTYTQNDTGIIRRYKEELFRRYGMNSADEVNKEIVRRYKNDEYPKILIVTDMLLTGFDVPELQVMYLDKPLREHRLLQAIARTNRPFKEVKEAGLIVDYVGIFSELERALENYSKEDLEGVTYDIDKLKERFESLSEKALDIFKGIPLERRDRRALMEAVYRLHNEGRAREFKSLYSSLRRVFELLGPDPIKTEYVETFKRLTKIYYAYRRIVEREDPEEVERYARKYYRKTLNYIHGCVDIEEIREDFPIIPLDENYLKNLEERYEEISDRVSDMIFTIKKYVITERDRDPFAADLAERVEEIIERWKSRKESVERTYEKLRQIFNEKNEMERRRKELGLTEEEYWILYVLKKYIKKEEEELLELARHIIDSTRDYRFKGWTMKPNMIKRVRATVAKETATYGLRKEERDALKGEIIKVFQRNP